MEPGFTILVTSEVVLAAITGRQQQCGLTRITLFPEKGNRFSVGQSEAFALVHPRRMVAYSNNMEGYFRQHPTTLRRLQIGHNPCLCGTHSVCIRKRAHLPKTLE